MKSIIIALFLAFSVSAIAEEPAQKQAEQQTAQQVQADECDPALIVADSEAAKQEELERRGCCSHHNGVCGCLNGRAKCCDGSLSPSCGCD
jgi:hypothetical protein